MINEYSFVPFYYVDFSQKEPYLYRKVGDIGKSLKMSSGSNVISGKGFVALFEFAADSYYWKVRVVVITNENKRYGDLIKLIQTHDYYQQHTMIYTFDEFKKNLDLPEDMWKIETKDSYFNKLREEFNTKKEK